MVVTGNEMKKMMSYSQIRMLMNAFSVSLVTCSFYALVEEAFVLVEIFFEEKVASVDLAFF